MQIKLALVRALFLAATVLGAQSIAAEDIKKTVHDAADSLGMVRLVTRNMELLNTVEYTATGSIHQVRKSGPWPKAELKRYTLGVSYLIPAARVDMERVMPDGKPQRQIQVVRDNRVWDEKGEPGMSPGPATGTVGERLPFIWLTPHGAIRAAVNAMKADPGSVKEQSTNDGATVLTIPVAGTQLKATLGPDRRVVRAEMPVKHPILGNTVMAAEFSDYKDFDLYGVFAPQRMKYTLGGSTLLELAISEFHSNPYVVFPPPELLKKASSKE